MLPLNELIMNLKMEDYLSDPGINSGLLKSILESRAHCRWYRRRPEKSERPQVLGKGIHSWILEPNTFDQEYSVPTEDWGPLNQNPGKALWTDFKAKAALEGKTPLKYVEGVWILEFAERCARHKALQSILASQISTEVTAVIQIDGIRYKARTDLLASDGTLWDVKTTKIETLDDEKIQREIFLYGYHFQAAHHLKVFGSIDKSIKKFGWIFTTKPDKELPQIRCLIASQNWLHYGGYDWHCAHHNMRNAMASNDWSDDGFEDQVTVINMPDWAIRNSMPGGHE